MFFHAKLNGRFSLRLPAVVVACSAGVFFGRANVFSRKRMLKRGEKMGRVKRSGVGGGEREEYFFSPPPLLFPSFALAPTLRVTVFTLPSLPPS